MISDVLKDNGQEAIDNVFAGTKAVGSILCVAFIPTVARNPQTGNPVVMPLKVATLVNLVADRPPSTEMLAEIAAANHTMQTSLG
ncbi:MAG: hypothetical protein CL627_02775 [Aurantimonas sp.]|nr:hypothetical protein [Aurantimonas sp.]